MPVLYSFRRCPYAIRARLALRCAGIDVRIVEVNLKNKPKEMLDYSPKGTVPVLVLENKKVIDESLDIVFWATECSDGRIRSMTPSEQTFFDDLSCSFVPALNRFKYHTRYPDVQLDKERAVLDAYLMRFEVWVKDNIVQSKIDCVGQVEILLLPFIRQYAMTNEDVFLSLNIPSLHVWFQNWMHDPIFIHVMQ